MERLAASGSMTEALQKAGIGEGFKRHEFGSNRSKLMHVTDFII